MRSDPLRRDPGLIEAPPAWCAIDFVSDLHLQAADPASAQAFAGWLARSDADALVILGDLFEVWVGDDLLAADPASDAEFPFLQHCCALLSRWAESRALYVMRGNRDFLLGERFAAASGATLLADPALLRWADSRVLLSHGDAWCLDDRDYLAFRARVRGEAWQRDFLSRPLAERCAIARALREQSEQRKADPQQVWADVDAATAAAELRAHDACTLVHGHTHRPDGHDLGDGLRRLVLSDWDAAAGRAEVLRLDRERGWLRLPA